VPLALVGALILGGLTLIGIGLTSDDEEPAPQSSEDRGPVPATPPPAEPGPSSESGQQGGSAAPAPGGAAGAPSAAAPSAGDVRLERRTFAQRFAIGVPPGWVNGVEDGGITLSAPGATAGIVVFFEQGAQPAPQLAQSARRFLAQRHPEAQIPAPKPVRLGPYRGLRVTATYPGGEEVAEVVSANGFSHLVLRRVDRGASAAVERQAAAALTSYRPK
jgi:hypothetical protein